MAMTENEALDLLISKLYEDYGDRFTFAKSNFALLKKDVRPNRTDYYFTETKVNPSDSSINKRIYCIDETGDYMIAPT